MRFTQFYSSGTECSPSRTALLTGRYQQRAGGLECAIGNGNVGRYDEAIRLRETHDLGLPATPNTLGHLLRRAGYRTGLTGKWHLGYEDKFSPGAHGFEHAFYALGGGMDYFHHVEEPPANRHVLRLNGREERRDGYFTELVAAEAEAFIARHRAEPFFLYVPFTAPHAPYQGPGDRRPAPLPDGSPLWKQSDAPPAVYTAMIESMDAAVGRIDAALRQHGLVDNTLVIFTNDNGGTRSARPSGLRDIKGTTFEGGIRVPCIARWPGRLAAGSESALVGLTMDLTASIAAAAGAQLVEGGRFDGVDLLGAVERGGRVERTVFWRGRRGANTWAAAREGALKYVRRSNAGKVTLEGLFDVVADPGEATDLLAARPAVAARLRAALEQWERDVRPTR